MKTILLYLNLAIILVAQLTIFLTLAHFVYMLSPESGKILAIAYLALRISQLYLHVLIKPKEK